MEQLPGEKDTIFIRLKNSIKKLWVEHYNYKPLQLVILSCIAGSTPFIGIVSSQLLPESFAGEKDIPTTTVIMESPEESTVTETVEHYVTMPNGDIKTYTDNPTTTYPNKEPQDEQVDTTTRNNDNTNNNDEMTPRKNNDYNSRYENTPTPQQNLREYPTYHSPEPTLNNKQSPNDNTVRTPQNNIPHNNTNNNTNSNNSNNTGDTGNTNPNNSNNDNNMNNNMNTNSNNNVNNDY